MRNMSYCRFENTYHDLKDCSDNLDDYDLSETETKYRQWLVKLCQKVVDKAEDLDLIEEEAKP